MQTSSHTIAPEAGPRAPVAPTPNRRPGQNILLKQPLELKR